MNARTALLSTAVLLPLMSATPAQAQRVEADIRIGGGPVAGRILIGDRYDRYDRYDRRPRAIRKVEWIRFDRRRDDWFRRFMRDARIVIVFHDRYDDRYYLDRFRPGLQEVRLYERGGRFYRLQNDRFDRRDDRWDDRRDDRWDDRRDNRRDGRDDR